MSTSMDVPHTQNTAPVLEFRCLFTPDIRRKQKRWQDGRLKYHTFNKRVMVYDERSNFVGDSHWREDAELDEGEELELERGGILVQVADFVGKRDQDLTEIVDKRIKEKEGRAAAMLAASPAVARSQVGTPASHLRPKALNIMLTPSGHYGRAVVSTTSPFEERQRLNGNGDGNENDRPAKKRKIVESSQSKNGYAQNLMGASLTLASSRPPGTASIRYEPFKTTITQQAPKTIDLTLDDDDNEVGDEVALSRRRDRVTEKRNLAAMKTKRHRSPPSKSTYAGNLTGVPLTLSRPNPVQSKRADTSLVTNPPPVNHRESSNSSSEDDNSFLGIDSSGIQAPFPTVRPTNSKAKKSIPEPTSCSSSTSTPQIERVKIPNVLPRKGPVHVHQSRSPSPVGNRASKRPETIPPAKRKERTSRSRSFSPVKNHVPKKQRPAPSLPRTTDKAVRQTEQHSVSALRIKARAPRKMMMFMDRPASRSSIREDFTSQPRPTNKTTQKPGGTSNDIVLSQATLQLNAFCQKQDEKLQARLNGQRARASLDLDDFDSSPLDSGINHQAIDELLTRKPAAIQMPAALDPKEAGSISRANSDSHSVSAKVVAQNGVAEKAIIDTRDSHDSIIDSSSSIEGHANEINTTPNEDAHPVSPKVLPRAEPNPDDLRKAGLRNPPESSSECNIEPSAVDVQTAVLNPATALYSDVPSPEAMNENEKPMAQMLPKVRPPRPHEPPKDDSGALERFRAIGKSSSTPPAQPDKAPCLPENTSIERIDDLLKEAIDFQKPEQSPKEIQLDQSPISSPIEQASLSGARDAIDLGFRSANNALAQSEVSKGLATTTSNTGVDARKRLINPATRGKSLQQTVAQANDAMAQALKAAMPPPPAPRISSRPSARPVLAGEAQQSVEGVPLTGPWSRESFDLFGNWRPPANAAPITGYLE